MHKWLFIALSTLPSLVPPVGYAQDGTPPIPKPGKQHEVLKNGEGVWDASMKLFMGGPDAPATESKGVETNRMLEGGFFCQGEFRGDIFGRTFVGKSVLGYDPNKGKYVGIWVDSMSPKIMHMEGAYDEATKTLTMWTESTDPATGMPLKEKQIHKAIDADTREFKIIQVGEGGKETVLMVVTYKRRAS
ncbi:MAG: DUF1579 domain-containing protein [Isosphaeraceae bacterium]